MEFNKIMSTNERYKNIENTIPDTFRQVNT